MSGDELRNVDVDQCVALRRNPQYLTPHQMDALKASIERDGFLAPVLLRPISDGKYEIVSGNHRVMAARELGLKVVPAVIKDIDDASAQRIAINLNTVHGNPNVELLAPFLAEMDDDVLASIHMDDILLKELTEFDALLKTRLDELSVPDSLDEESSQGVVPKACTCPTCGKKHADARVSSSSS